MNEVRPLDAAEQLGYSRVYSADSRHVDQKNTLSLKFPRENRACPAGAAAVPRVLPAGTRPLRTHLMLSRAPSQAAPLQSGAGGFKFPGQPENSSEGSWGQRGRETPTPGRRRLHGGSAGAPRLPGRFRPT